MALQRNDVMMKRVSKAKANCAAQEAPPQIRYLDFEFAYRILLSYLGRDGVGQEPAISLHGESLEGVIEEQKQIRWCMYS